MLSCFSVNSSLMDTACVLLLATEVVMATACRSEVAQQNERSHFVIRWVG